MAPIHERLISIRCNTRHDVRRLMPEKIPFVLLALTQRFDPARYRIQGRHDTCPFRRMSTAIEPEARSLIDERIMETNLEEENRAPLTGLTHGLQ